MSNFSPIPDNHFRAPNDRQSALTVHKQRLRILHPFQLQRQRFPVPAVPTAQLASRNDPYPICLDCQIKDWVFHRNDLGFGRIRRQVQ